MKKTNYFALVSIAFYFLLHSAALGCPELPVNSCFKTISSLSHYKKDDPRFHLKWKPDTVSKIGEILLQSKRSNSGKINFDDSSITKQLESQLPLIPVKTTHLIPISDDHDILMCHHYEALLRLSLAQEVFPELDADHLSLSMPDTPPGSNAQVYLIKNDKTGILIGVLKIPHPSKAIEELANTFAAETFLKSYQDKIRSVTTRYAGQFTNGRYFWIQSAAPGRDLNSFLPNYFNSKISQEERKSFDSKLSLMAAGLSKLHHINSALESPAQPSNEFEKLIRSVDTRILDNTEGILGLSGYGLNHGEIPVELREKLAKKISHLKEDFLILRRSRPNLFLNAVIHGDAHGGNFLIDDKNQVTMIDYDMILKSINDGQHQGNGDPAKDVGIMIARLQLLALQNGASVAEALRIQKKFLDKYKDGMSIVPNSEREKAFDLSVKLEQSMPLVWVLVGREKATFKSKSQDLSTDELRKKAYQLWEQFL